MKRKANIELLRIVSMIMIIFLHLFNQGGVLSTVSTGFNYYSTWIIEAICHISVNCYILITGYFAWKTKFIWKRIISFYFILLFYTFILAIISFTFKIEHLTFKNLVGLFPIVSRRNWFVTVYFACMFIIPYLNCTISLLSQNSHRILLLILLSFFSLTPTLFFYVDQFNVNNGYSILWYLSVYLIGAYIGKYNIYYNKLKCYFCLSVIIFLPISKFLINNIVSSAEEYENVLYSYNSLPVLISSFGMFMLFKNLNIDNCIISNIINLFGKTTFGVFYIHSFFLIRNHLWISLGSLKYLDSLFFLPYSFIVVITIFFACSFIDLVRIRLFRLSFFTNFIEHISSLLNKHAKTLFKL